MSNEADLPVVVNERAAEWHREAGYHLSRASQEQKLAARAALPEARIAHEVLARSHTELAGVANMAAVMSGVEPLHTPRASEASFLLKESFTLT